MGTYRILIADVKKTHGEAFTDSKITSTQVLWFTLVAANRLRKDSGIKSGTGMYLNTFSPVPVLLDIAMKNRQYIELPASIFNIEHDRAVEVLTYNEDTCCCSGPNFAQVFFQPTTKIKSWILYLLPYTKPTTKNPYFYREGNRLYFLGTECITIKDVEIQLFTSLDPLTEVNIDDTIGLADELILQLRATVIDMCKYAYLFPSERKNISFDETPKTKVPAQDLIKKQPEQQGQE